MARGSLLRSIAGLAASSSDSDILKKLGIVVETSKVGDELSLPTSSKLPEPPLDGHIKELFEKVIVKRAYSMRAMPYFLTYGAITGIASAMRDVHVQQNVKKLKEENERSDAGYGGARRDLRNFMTAEPPSPITPARRRGMRIAILEKTPQQLRMASEKLEY